MVLLDDVPYTLKQRYNWYVLHKNYADRNERSCEILRKIVFLPGVCKLWTPTVRSLPPTPRGQRTSKKARPG